MGSQGRCCGQLAKLLRTARCAQIGCYNPATYVDAKDCPLSGRGLTSGNARVNPAREPFCISSCAQSAFNSILPKQQLFDVPLAPAVVDFKSVVAFTFAESLEQPIVVCG